MDLLRHDGSVSRTRYIVRVVKIMLFISRAKSSSSNEAKLQILYIHTVVNKSDFDGLFDTLFDLSTIVVALCVKEQPTEFLHALDPFVFG